MSTMVYGMPIGVLVWSLPFETQELRQLFCVCSAIDPKATLLKSCIVPINQLPAFMHPDPEVWIGSIFRHQTEDRFGYAEFRLRRSDETRVYKDWRSTYVNQLP